MSYAKNRVILVSVLTFLAAVAFLGCSSGELDKLRSDLKTCGDRRNSLAREIDGCRKESARLKQRLNGFQAALAAPLPPSVKEAREEFISTVPEQVRVEMELQLDSYFTAVSREFKELQDRNQEILQEMKSARREISQKISKTSGQVEKVASSASNLEEGLAVVQKGNEELRQLSELQQAQQQRTAADLQRIVESVIEFDSNRLNCRECRERLRMMGKNREEILRFHSTLVQKLTALQVDAGGI